jgi:LemA protein
MVAMRPDVYSCHNIYARNGVLMGVFGFIILAVIAMAVIYLIMLYNGLVSLKNNVKEAWANIDVLLKQRHDELPKLVETCKQYMGYEKDTLEKVMQARAGVQQARESGDVAALGPAEAQMRAMIGKLYAVAEAYPQLKANESFQQLQGRITGLENAIADRREFYNDSVNLYNTRIQQFPDLLIANQFSFKPGSLLEFSDEEKKDVDVKALFS